MGRISVRAETVSIIVVSMIFYISFKYKKIFSTFQLLLLANVYHPFVPSPPGLTTVVATMAFCFCNCPLAVILVTFKI